MATAKSKEKEEKAIRKNCSVESHGDKIVLPEGMTEDEGIEWLRRHKEENERVVAVSEVVEAFPADGAYALTTALSEKYGWTSLVPTPSFWGPTPPAMIGIPTDAKGGSVQVPWGRIQIPGVSGHIETSAMIKDGRWLFVIGGEVRRKNEAEVKEIANLTRDIIRTRSMYRGKAIKVKFVHADPRQGFDPRAECPSFIDCSTINEAELILNDKVRAQIDTAILTPIEKTEICRTHKIPLKRGILLEGPYGTGKSLTAYLTAKASERHGWTFIYLSDVGQLQKAIFFAKQYSPAVIFAEDIDRVVTGERTIEMDQILNTIDGIDTKDSEIIVVLTTNHIDRISKAMLRPGRLDAIVSFQKPDAKSVERLVRMYGRDLVPVGLEFPAVCDKMANHIPSVIREMVERAKLAAIRNQDVGKKLILSAADLDLAADSMLEHVKFMEDRPFDARTTPLGQISDIVAKGLGGALGAAVAEGLKSTEVVKQAAAMWADRERKEAAAAPGNGARNVTPPVMVKS